MQSNTDNTSWGCDDWRKACWPLAHFLPGVTLRPHFMCTSVSPAWMDVHCVHAVPGDPSQLSACTDPPLTNLCAVVYRHVPTSQTLSCLCKMCLRRSLLMTISRFPGSFSSWVKSTAARLSTESLYLLYLWLWAWPLTAEPSRQPPFLYV